MRHFIGFMFMAAVLIAAFASCDKKEELPREVKSLTVEASKSIINNDGEDEAVFTVRYGGEDVSKTASIEVNGAAIKGNSFASTTIGTYTIVAKYDGLTSNEITVQVKDLVNALILTVDREVFEPDGEDTVHFTVTQGDVDITDKVQVCSADEDGVCLTEPFFNTTYPGTYKFYSYFKAAYDTPDHPISNIVEITAIVMKDTGVSYEKNVAIFTFTATWCGPCYRYKNTLKALEDDYGNRLITVNFYSDPNNKDGGSDKKVTTEITGQFQQEVVADGRCIFSGWPTSIAELDLNFAQPQRIPSEDEARGAYNEYIARPAKTGIKASSSIEGGKVNASVEIAAEATGRYYLGALLVEDNVIAPQFPGGGDGYIEDYNHSGVLRGKAMESLYGDAIGVIEGGDTATKNLSFNLESKYVPENLSLVIYTLSMKDGYRKIDNTVTLPANGSVDYVLAE